MFPQYLRRIHIHRIFFFIGIFAILSFAISCTQTKEFAQIPPAGTAPRRAGPPQVVQIDDAKLKQLLTPNGKPLLVNFWATWCGPCREEFPDLVKIDSEYRGKIDFITISLDFIEEMDTGVPQFLSEMNAEMPTYLLISGDENKLISSIAENWSGGLPFTVLYNESGDKAYLHQGKVSYDTLKSEIEKELTQ